MSIAKLSIQTTASSLNLVSEGDWSNAALNPVFEQLQGYKIDSSITHVNWDFSGVENLETPALILVVQFFKRFDKSQVSFSVEGLSAQHQRMLIFYRKNSLAQTPKAPAPANFFARLGKSAIDFFHGFKAFAAFFGEALHGLWEIVKKPSQLRYSACVKHIESSGFRAIPIIGLTAFLVGLVIAYQSSEQLSRFGANIFIVEMVSISMFRELAPMIAAIVVAGRSASAYTAEIGTMKITEEIDAMRTMGFEPQFFLIWPRIIALVISMPLIVFFADIVGMFGGMLIARFDLGISFGEFLSRLQAEVSMRHILIGLVKAPFFGLVIALIGTYRGFQVTGSTDSIGYYTTVSVVNAIFWVIASNALISVLLTELGV